MMSNFCQKIRQNPIWPILGKSLVCGRHAIYLKHLRVSTKLVRRFWSDHASRLVQIERLNAS